MTDSRPGQQADRTDRVAVRSRFDGAWCGGFEVADRAHGPDGVSRVQLRRLSDGAILPVWFDWAEVVPDEH